MRSAPAERSAEVRPKTAQPARWNTALTAVVSRYRSRGAVREVGKAAIWSGLTGWPQFTASTISMHLELAGVTHRDLGDRRRIGAVAVKLCDAAMDSGRQRLAPFGLLGNCIEDRPMLRERSHDRTAELERVSACRFRHLVDEAFHIDGVLVRIDAAPRPDRNVGVAHCRLGDADTAPVARR
jgi:hypothetical protein